MNDTASSATASTAQPVPPLDHELFAQLKALRSHIAVKEGVPLYMVFANASLEEMATYYPQTKEDFGQLKGVGKYKVIRYADQFLPTIVSFCQKQQLQSRMDLAPKPVKEHSPTMNAKSVETTVLYFKQGLSIEEIAVLRKIALKTVISHLVFAYAHGADITIDAFVPAEKQQSITEIFQKLGTTRLTTVMEKLSGYTYDDLRWVRAKLNRDATASAWVSFRV